MSLYYEKGRSLVVMPSNHCDDSADGCVVHWPSQAIDTAPKHFVYVQVEKLVEELARTLPRTGKTGVLASSDPDFLVKFFQIGCNGFRLALRVTTTKDLAGLARCPHDGVDIPEALASHEMIHRIQRTSKEVYVRIPGGANNLRPKRIARLVYEKVDILIAHTDYVLRTIKSVDRTGA